MNKKNKKVSSKQKTKAKKSSKVLYVIAIIVLLIPVCLLGYIYLGAKENSGKPVVGSRFDRSLDPAITEEDIQKVKDALKFDQVDSIEVNLTSATLRITIDTADNISNDALTDVMNSAYDKVDDILPIKTYFTNQKSTKMYDLDIHVYNFVPDDTHSEDDQIYKEKTKNASNDKAVVDTLTTPRNKEEADELLKQQEDLNK